MFLKSIAAAFLLVLLVASLVGQHTATEAPAGFDTPTIADSPGSQSVSNGILEPPGDTFAQDQFQFERQHDPGNGLGPLFNAASCAQCHQNVVTGAPSQITEIRAGHRDQNGNFVNATVLINHGATPVAGRSIVNDRSVCPEAQEHVPDGENVRSLRAVLNTLGDGFVEAVSDETFRAISDWQSAHTSGVIHGEVIEVPVLESPGQTRVGRFGWKDQQPTLLSFAADAYLNEMGITSRLRPKDVTTVCKVTLDPEDVPDAIGMEDIDHFAQFMRGTKVPPRDPVLAATADARVGQDLFEKIGCATCHISTMKTMPAGAVINGGAYTVPDAIGDKIIHPYGDFLLHDIGTGDGIVQGGPQDTANKLRTVPLWGLHIKSRLMHDLKSLTLESAIRHHRGEAEQVREHFDRLTVSSASRPRHREWACSPQPATIPLPSTIRTYRFIGGFTTFSTRVLGAGQCISNSSILDALPIPNTSLGSWDER
jgi:cytochrome c551/c552